MPNQPSFFDRQFDKLLVTFVFLIIIGLVVLFAFLRPDAPFKWAIEAFGLFFGLFSGLITGYHMGKNSVDPPQPPPLVASQTVTAPAPAPAPAPLPDPQPIAQTAPVSTWTPAQPQIAPQK